MITTLLVIEDNEGDARLLREMFTETKVGPTRMLQAASVREAEEQLAAHDIDVILLDLGLPDAQGLGAVRRVQAAAPHVPLVILTGLDDETMATDALQIGAQDYLVKGQIEPQMLSRALRYAVERQALDAALFSERERAQVTLDSIGDAVASMDLAGAVTFLNRAAQHLTGWSQEDAAGTHVSQVLAGHGLDSSRILDVSLADPESALASFDLPSMACLLRRDGREVAIAGSISRIHDRAHRITGMVVVFRDVTDQRPAEAAMRRSEERFRRLFESNTIGITVSEFNGRVLEANDAFLAMVSYTRDELEEAALDWEAVTAPEYVASNQRARDELRDTGVAKPWEKQYLRRDGTRVPVLVGMAMLEANEPTCISYIVDLSTLRDLESRLRQAQKMEAIGQLAGGIAHDFNNLLTVILGHTELTLEQLTVDDPLLGSIEEIRDASTRAAAMTRQLLAFSRRQVLEQHELDINILVSKVEQLLRRLIGEDIELVVTLMPDACLVLADAGQIEQVVMNLVVNARDAMPDGGSLTITVGELDIPAASESATATVLAPGSYITITVTDTGTGMSALTKTHLFEPFYTTKRSEKGTGLGLATAYGIIKQSGGDIHVTSELGQGSAFVVHLPRSDNGAELAPAPAPAGEVVEARAIGTVLLVEDDPAVRRLTRRMLEMRGYRVLEAIDAESALAKADSYNGPINVLLTDVVMPRMSGIELATRLGEGRPATRVVFMSGYTDDRVNVRALARRPSFLPKPFTSEALAVKLREATA